MEQDIRQSATIQVNALSGMGDIFCDIYTSILISKELKSIGYKVDLLFYWGPHPVNLSEIFDQSFFDYFDSVNNIDRPIKENTYHGNSHVGFSGPPGNHHVDLFLSDAANIFSSTWYSDNHVSASKYIKSKLKHKYSIGFTDHILNMAYNALSSVPKKHIFLHIRTRDQTHKESLAPKFLDYIDANLSDKNIHVGSNDLLLVDKICEARPNIYRYDFSDLTTYNCNVQAKKFTDVLAAMVTVKFADEIYYFSEYAWVSNFIYYGLTHRGEKPAHKIKL